MQRIQVEKNYLYIINTEKEYVKISFMLIGTKHQSRILYFKFKRMFLQSFIYGKTLLISIVVTLLNTCAIID